jgi:hypothetical protein
MRQKQDTAHRTTTSSRSFRNDDHKSRRQRQASPGEIDAQIHGSRPISPKTRSWICGATRNCESANQPPKRQLHIHQDFAATQATKGELVSRSRVNSPRPRATTQQQASEQGASWPPWYTSTAARATTLKAAEAYPDDTSQPASIPSAPPQQTARPRSEIPANTQPANRWGTAPCEARLRNDQARSAATGESQIGRAHLNVLKPSSCPRATAPLGQPRHAVWEQPVSSQDHRARRRNRQARGFLRSPSKPQAHRFSREAHCLQSAQRIGACAAKAGVDVGAASSLPIREKATRDLTGLCQYQARVGQHFTLDAPRSCRFQRTLVRVLRD